MGFWFCISYITGSEKLHAVTGTLLRKYIPLPHSDVQLAPKLHWMQSSPCDLATPVQFRIGLKALNQDFPGLNLLSAMNSEGSLRKTTSTLSYSKGIVILHRVFVWIT